MLGSHCKDPQNFYSEVELSQESCCSFDLDWSLISDNSIILPTLKVVGSVGNQEGGDLKPRIFWYVPPQTRCVDRLWHKTVPTSEQTKV